MPFAASLSTNEDWNKAFDEVCSSVQQQLQAEPDLALLFYAPDFLPSCFEMAQELQARLKPKCALGCPGETIIGLNQEIERSPALSLWAAKWSQPVKLHPFHLYMERTSEGLSLLGWPDVFLDANVPPEQIQGGQRNDCVLMLGDPYSFPADVFLRNINEHLPGLRVMGGMASGVSRPGECRMIYNDQQIDQGAIGILLEGDMTVRSVVSQGCRPIGQHMVITKAEENVIKELSGKTPYAQLQELFAQLSPEDQQLMQQGLHVGCVMNEYQEDFHQGDFLIRNVMGLEKESGALIIAEQVRVGQTIQFQVRDSGSADNDLNSLLQMDIVAHEKKPAGALLFSCNGRGTHMFEGSHHDAKAVGSHAGEIPTAGFFAQGELGPVGGKNFIHGFTASVVLFED
ncbi:MAG: FIST N-terminal domain-containing protein [Gemmataceae bacterium]